MPLPTITSLDFFIVTPNGCSCQKQNKKGVRTERGPLVVSLHIGGDAFVLAAPHPPLEGASHVTGIGHGVGVAMRVPGEGSGRGFELNRPLAHMVVGGVAINYVAFQFGAWRQDGAQAMGRRPKGRKVRIRTEFFVIGYTKNFAPQGSGRGLTNILPKMRYAGKMVSLRGQITRARQERASAGMPVILNIRITG
ncbi:hypothetical protein [Acidovorax sp. SUPP3334]|uniref:hypothetical protein n=1 Tax=Acidovorax sp. SUPP3334 TaxID=2920881 RepID=UPI0023DE1AED|nr:hypothetical protein [Acidovorax sp. SUPP3334]GKT26324.1 hypothetical protein AVHM3334_20675 [Acidovorax sp. SUPP3334]